MTRRRAVGPLALAALLICTGADWRQFRGTRIDALGDAPVPTDWSSGVPIAWTADLEGRGVSSPIIVGGRVILTSNTGFQQDRLHVLCFDDRSGELLWDRQFWATGRTVCNPKTCIAAPTPASDGERIFAAYSSNDVVCLDLDGRMLWHRGLTYDYPKASNSLGMASSPVVVGETLAMMIESDSEGFAVGLDVHTGRSRWRIDRPHRSNWTTPVLLEDDAQPSPLVLLQSSAGVSAVDPLTGREQWSYDDGAATIPSSVVAGPTVYVPSHGITALRRGRSNAAVPEIVWNEGSLRPGTASPVAHQGAIYVVNSSGVLARGDLETGRRQWQLRLGGNFSSSPVIAGEDLFIVSEDGTLLAVRLGADRGQIVGRHEFGETILATPAIANGALYIRSDRHLWKIAEGDVGRHR